jgi:agmatine deiminase
MRTTTGLQMPAESAPHERCLMAWPARPSLWHGYAEQARAEYAATANAIAAFEPVTMVAAPGQGAQVRAACSTNVDVIELPIDDSWMRDSGPIFVTDGHGEIAGVDFRFNSWGERFLPYDLDAAVSAKLLAALGVERIESSMILEGGSITVDGEGTLITTEQCLLHPNRNPSLGKDEIEAELSRTLGVSTVIWLKWGHVEDTHTDGHVDAVCAFVRPGVVLAQSCEDPDNPNYALMAENLAILRAARDAKGRSLEVIELPQFAYFDLDGMTLMTSYPNFYLANGAVIVPIADHPLDEEALSIIAGAFPEREVVGVASRIVAFGGGGTHCITQQLPVAGAPQ